MKAGGGLVTQDDLKSYRAKWREPLEFTYRGRHVVGMPPPSSGGLTMAMIAHLLDGYDLRTLGWHSPEAIHLTAEAMRRAFAARNAKLGDPDFVKNPIVELLSEEWAKQQGATIRSGVATPTKDLFPAIAGAKEGPHTTNMAVVDKEGNAVELTTTLNAWFGAGVAVAGLGFVLNDEMDDFATVVGTANMFGLVQGEPNAIAPGKRMLSSMSPTLVLGNDGGVELAIGAAGGSRIITTVFEEMSNALDYGMEVADAVRAPRFHQQDSPDILLLEPHGLPEEVMQALQAHGPRNEGAGAHRRRSWNRTRARSVGRRRRTTAGGLDRRGAVADAESRCRAIRLRAEQSFGSKLEGFGGRVVGIELQGLIAMGARPGGVAHGQPLGGEQSVHRR